MLSAVENPLAGLGEPRPNRARSLVAIGLLCGALLATSIGKGTIPAWGATDDDNASPEVDLDPLRRFLPRSDIFMPVPGGIAAVSGDPAQGESGSVAERAQRLHGGLVVGYCLRASCSRVTHLAILQVCNSRIGGLDGSDRLILGVVKLPFGDVPGRLMSLQGRNYVENFSLYGPYTQDLVDETGADNSALHNIWAEGMGPVAPLQYLGLSVKAQQSRETIALQMTVVPFQRSDLRLPRLEVRHFCEKPMS